MQTKVLIADDDEQVLSVLGEMLESVGYSVIAKAVTGREACEMNKALVPDVLLLDLNMPEMDGLEAARTIMRAKPAPIILCTASCDEELILEAARAGIFAYIVKPFNITDLIPAITIARHRFADTASLRSEVARLNDALETRKWVEKAKGIVMKLRSMDEEQAHRFLQMESQRRSQPLADLSKAIVTTQEMLKADETCYVEQAA